MPLTLIDDSRTANFSNYLISSDITIAQQRILTSAVAAFAPSNKAMIAEINDFIANIESDLIALKDNNSKSARLKEFDNLPRVIDNIQFEGEAGTDTRKVIWSATAAIECTRIFFRLNPEYRNFLFDSHDFITYWTPELLARENAKVSNITKSMNKSLKRLSGATYQARFTENDIEVNRHIPVFSELAVTSKAVEVSLNEAFMPYLVFYSSELAKVGYTQLPIYFVRHANSEYTMKLLMTLLRRINRKGAAGVREITINIDDFRTEMGVRDQYKKRNDLVRNVIDLAVKDILEITANADSANKAIDAGSVEYGGRKKTFKLLKMKGDANEPSCYYEFFERGRKTYSISFKIDPSGLLDQKLVLNTNTADKTSTSKKKASRGKYRDLQSVTLPAFLQDKPELSTSEQADAQTQTTEPRLAELLGVQDKIGNGGGKIGGNPVILNAIKESSMPF